jgi:hypothetical protein
MKSNTSILLLALGLAAQVGSPAAEPLLSPKAAANQTRVVRTTNLNHLNAKTPAGSPRIQAQQARPSRTVVPRVQALPGTRLSPPSARSVKMPSSFSTSAASPAPLVLTNTTGQKVTLPTLSPGMTVSDPNSGVSVPVKSLIR